VKTLQQRLESAAREITEHVETSFDRPSFQPQRTAIRLRRFGLVAATATVFAFCILAVVAIAPFGSDSPSADDPVSTTFPAPAVPDQSVPVPGSDTATALDAYVWTRVSDPDLGGPGEQVIHSVRLTSAGLVAVGTDDERSAIWWSPDGEDWVRTDDPAGAFGTVSSAYGDESVMWLLDVTDNGSRMVAVGIDLLDRAGVSSVGNPKVKSMAFWYSDDGLAWNRVPHDEELFGMGAAFLNRPVKVTTTDFGFMAVGEAIWTSADGMTWLRQEAPGHFVTDVIATDDGFLLVGQDRAGDEYRPAAWYSSDGITWSAAGVEAGNTGSDGFLLAVTRIEEGYLALGPGSGAMVWFSPDGYTWTFRGGYTENDGYAYDRPNDLAAIDGHVVAVGERWPHTGQGAALWESADEGLSWTVFSDPEGILGNARSETRQSAAYSILVYETRFVVGGRFGGDDSDGQPSGDAAIWIGIPNDS
jgi:hypothetical protein